MRSYLPKLSLVLCIIFLGRVLLGLFPDRNTRNRQYLCSFRSYSVFGINGISLSAPDSRMNRMEGLRFTRNRQNTRSFGKMLAGNRRYSSSQVTSDSVSRSETCRSVLFEIEIPCILLFLNWNKISQNSPKRMHP